jgi:hypothetical protein
MKFNQKRININIMDEITPIVAVNRVALTIQRTTEGGEISPFTVYSDNIHVSYRKTPNGHDSFYVHRNLPRNPDGSARLS